MSIFVSEPARPGPQRLPEELRHRTARRISAGINSSAIAAQDDQDPTLSGARNRQAARRAAMGYQEGVIQEASPKLAYLPVSELGGQAVITISSHATLEDARRLMDQHGIHHLVVLHDEVVAGLIDMQWVLAQQLAPAGHSAQTRLSGMTLPGFITVTAETDAHDLARQMLGYQIAAAIIVGPDNLATSLLTATDYLRLYAQQSRMEERI